MRKFKIILLILIIILAGAFFFQDEILDFYSELSLGLPKIEKGISDFLIKEVEKQILTPPPLRLAEEAAESFLTKVGVIQWTNIQRETSGLPPLKENTRLDLSAELKVQDMFEKQYFSHYSASGEGVGDLVEIAGYQFIAIGENLALGNFENDEALVQGWMDSQGHRENILNPNYQEIGVAVMKDTFEGKSTWLAVQHFGLPLSACLQPDKTKKTEIEANQDKIEELETTLSLLQNQIRNIRPKRGPIYNQAIDQYNTLVSEYNVLVEKTKLLVKEYNSQVKLFNDCVAGVE